MPIGPFAFFRIYQGVHLHFTSKYDVLKFNFKGHGLNQDAFNNRKDNHQFHTWSIRFDNSVEAMEYCVFNFLRSSTWLYGTHDEAKSCYLAKKKYYSLFKKNIKDEHELIKRLIADKKLSFDDLLKPTKSGNKPPILQLYLNGDVSIEFMCLLADGYKFTDNWVEQYAIDPLVTSEINKLIKYRPFVTKFSGYGQENSQTTS